MGVSCHLGADPKPCKCTETEWALDQIPHERLQKNLGLFIVTSDFHDSIISLGIGVQSIVVSDRLDLNSALWIDAIQPY